MLSRTADNLYWLARYVERAEATLRLVRWRVGDWTVDGIAPGTWREVSV